MRILICHNRYQFRGGEDAAFESHRDLLIAHGHEVICYERSNDEQNGRSAAAMLLTSMWSRRTWRDVTRLIQQYRPEILHCHNTVSMISSSIYWAAHSQDVPVVQTLHNFRMLCANALLFRQGRPCELCLGRWTPWPSLLYACYRDSRMATAALTASQQLHRLLRTNSRCINRYVALTQFARDKFITSGIPPGKISVIPNFAKSPAGTARRSGQFVLFLGRLSREKGISLLADIWSHGTNIPLVIAGDGPMSDEVRHLAKISPAVQYLGWQSREQVEALLKAARFVILPSLCYEGFPVAAAEALGNGIPVLASNRGGLPSIVDDGVTGFLFDPDDAVKATAIIKKAWNTDVDTYCTMSETCTQQYRSEYSPSAHYHKLMDVYRDVISEHKRPRKKMTTDTKSKRKT